MPDQLQIRELLHVAEPPEAQPDSTRFIEDLALARLKDPALSRGEIEQLSRNPALMKSRKIRLALAAHSDTPRRIALRIIRELYNFDLMQFSQTPAAPADLKRVADELLVSRLASISLGERIALARRSSTLVTGALLLDKDPKVWQPALENPRLIEVAIVKALQRTTSTPAFVEAVSRHSKWSLRHEVQVALLRNAHTPLARAIEFAPRLSVRQLRDILHTSRLPDKIKTYLRREKAAGQ